MLRRVALTGFIALWAATLVAQSPVEAKVKATLEKQVLTLRQCSGGKRLDFNAKGELKSVQPAGAAGNCVLRVGKARVRNDVAEVRAQRVIVVHTSDAKVALVDTEEDVELRIPLAGDVDTALFRVFLPREEAGGQLPMANYVPRSHPGKAPPDAAVIDGELPGVGPVYRATKRVMPAKVIEAPDLIVGGPFAGRHTVMLRIIVGAQGGVEYIELPQPSGTQFDAGSIRGLAHWKFSPAELDGKPVAVVFNVEATFQGD